MPYANGYIRINISGSAYSDNEIWNTGFNIITSPSVNIDMPLLEQVAGVVKTAWDSFFSVSGQGVGFYSTHYTDMIKASHIGLDGKVVNNHVWEDFYEPSLRGPASGPFPAPQLALVATLRSEVRKGPAALGRMYLPAPMSSVELDGQLSSSNVDTMVQRFGGFLRAVNGGMSEGIAIGLTSPVGEGVQASVTRFRIDNRMDTQRRRANHIPTEGDFVDLVEE